MEKERSSDEDWMNTHVTPPPHFTKWQSPIIRGCVFYFFIFFFIFFLFLCNIHKSWIRIIFSYDISILLDHFFNFF
jgi:hypothetical protein